MRAREATSGAIRALLDLAPKTARRVKDDGSEEEVSLDTVTVGDRLRVRPGDKVPVDGVVLEGRSSLDESMVTGESMPVTKVKDARVIGGTINKPGSFVMRADKIGRDTLLRRSCRWSRRRSAAARRSSASPIRSRPGLCRGHRHRADRIRRLGDVRPGTALRLALVAAVSRADHRLPLRAGSGDADVDHGRRRPRRAGGVLIKNAEPSSAWRRSIRS